ncbi:MAG: hypothetical protein ACLT8H_10105 [Streptococcus parasanguinis]
MILIFGGFNQNPENQDGELIWLEWKMEQINLKDYVNGQDLSIRSRNGRVD